MSLHVCARRKNLLQFMKYFIHRIVTGVVAGEFSVRFLGRGRELEVEMKWPEPIFYLNVIHKKRSYCNG